MTFTKIPLGWPSVPKVGPGGWGWRSVALDSRRWLELLGFGSRSSCYSPVPIPCHICEHTPDPHPNPRPGSVTLWTHTGYGAGPSGLWFVSASGGGEGVHSENNVLHFYAASCLAFSHWRVLGRIQTRRITPGETAASWQCWHALQGPPLASLLQWQ